MKKEELAQIVENHGKWLSGDGGERANLSDADLRGANLSDANLSDADLLGANLSDADLSDAGLRGADLRCADLRCADLSDADLSDANLSGADLRGADLRGADLIGADLSGANLSDANLSGADLRGADLWSTAGNRNQIKSLFVSEDYAIVYTSDYLQIGCERHPISEWWEFENRRILEMDGKRALEFWKIWKPLIKQMIDFSPANPTGFVKK